MNDIDIFVGTVTGNALSVAEEIQEFLISQGKCKIRLFEEPNNFCFKSFLSNNVIIVTSTTGDGEIPDNISKFYSNLKQNSEFFKNKQYGIVALGDTKHDHFCAAGKMFENLCARTFKKCMHKTLFIDAMNMTPPETLAICWIKKFISAMKI